MNVDIGLRNVLAPTFCILEAVSRNNWWPLACGAFAMLHFASGVFSEVEHAMLLHLPVMIGFFCMLKP
jgi:hypothetical protein